MDPKETSQEELNAEAEALKESKEEEIRATVITEYGFDEVDDQERIDKLVTEKVQSKKMLSDAIGQKIKYRDKLKSTTPPAPVAPKTPEVDVAKTVIETLEQRDLEALEYPDELKADIQNLTRVKGITVKAALKDPYIQFKLGEHEKLQKAAEATITRKPNASGKANYSVDDDPPEIDTSSPEAFKKSSEEYEKYKEAMKAKGY